MPPASPRARVMRIAFWTLIALVVGFLVYLGLNEQFRQLLAAAPGALPSAPGGSFFDRLLVGLARQVSSGVGFAEKAAIVLYAVIKTALAFAFAVLVMYVLQWMLRLATARLGRRTDAARRHMQTLRSLIGSTIRYAVLIATALWVLGSAWGVDTSSLVVGTAVIGAALAFGSQDLIKDIIAGISLLVEGQLNIGDWVRIGDREGKVESVGLRTTRLVGADGQVHYIFNRSIDRISAYARGYVQALVDVNLADAVSAARAGEIIAAVGAALARSLHSILAPPQVGGLERPDQPDRRIRVIFRVRPADQLLFQQKVAARLTEAFKAADVHLGPYGIEVQFGEVVQQL